MITIMNPEHIDCLIEEVRANPVIWDKRNKMHSNGRVVDASWDTISQKLGFPKADLKTKWRNVRDYYRSKCNKRVKLGSGAIDNQNSTWPYFSQLAFLDDVFTPRNTRSGNIVSVRPTSTTSNVVICKSDVDNMLTFQVSPDDPLYDEVELADEVEKSITEEEEESTTKKIKKSVTVVDVGLQLVHIEREKLKILENKDLDDNDCDTQFFRSILPDFKSLTNIQKLECKIEIQRLLLKYIKKEY